MDKLKHPLLSFYDCTDRDSAGRLLTDVWELSYDELEWEHDFIQWLFPLIQRSQFIPDAPVLTESIIQQFRTNEALQNNLVKSLDVMLRFYGLKRKENKISRSKNFSQRSDEWLYKDNHNHLRLSRIIQSLHILGLEKLAQNLKTELLEIAEIYGPDRVSLTTKNYWKNLIKVE